MTVYDELRAEVVGLMRDTDVRQGTVTLTRTTTADPDPSTPWEPGAPTTTVYTLDAAVSGAGKKYIDGSLILITDRMLTVSPVATLSGTRVDVEPAVGDLISIDGAVGIPAKAVRRLPEAGIAAAYLIFVAG